MVAKKLRLTIFSYLQAAERANVHMNLLMCCDTRVLRLNKLQDVIHTSFRNAFPELDVHKVTPQIF